MDNVLEIDSYIYTEDMALENEVYVKKTVKNINVLQKTYGLTNADIRKLDVVDGCIEVYGLLYPRGFSFSPEIGFYMKSLNNNTPKTKESVVA